MWPGPTAQLAPLAILALLVAFPVALVWHARRGHMMLAARLASADALLVASVLVILRATLPSTEPSSGLGSWTWMPFEDLIRAWPIDWARHVILGQMAANVLLFVPFGLALTLRGWRVPVWRVAIVSVAFSIGIELTQGVAGNGRSADITDVLMNTLGGVCGWAVGRALLLLLAWITRRARSGRHPR